MAGSVLEHIRATNKDGALLPQTVVAVAQDPANPLHLAFEWDDSKAAKAFRVEQAREMIASLEIRTSSDTTERVYLNTQVFNGTADGAGRTRGYVPLGSAIQNVSQLKVGVLGLSRLVSTINTTIQGVLCAVVARSAMDSYQTGLLERIQHHAAELSASVRAFLETL